MVKIRIKHFNPETKDSVKKYAESAGLREFNSLDVQHKFIPEGVYELDEGFLFSNQYNTKEQDGHKRYRVFEYNERLDTHYDCRPSGYGYYIAEGIEEIRALQSKTLSCGFCGKQYRDDAHVEGGFCTACMDSEYLKASELRFLRLVPVIEHNPTRPEITPEEKALLLPLYIKRQTTGATSRARIARKKALISINSKYKRAKSAAETEHKGFLWLYKKRVPLDNFIYYDRKGTFCLGWRSPIDPETRGEWEKKLAGFPFPLEIKSRIARGV